MGTLMIDEENEEAVQPMIIGKVVTLPDNWKPTPRQISETAVLKYNFKLVGKTAVEPAVIIEPKIATVAMCATCATRRRSGNSHLCARCIRRRSLTMRRRSILDAQIAPADAMIVAAIIGLFVAALINFIFSDAR